MGKHCHIFASYAKKRFIRSIRAMCIAFVLFFSTLVFASNIAEENLHIWIEKEVNKKVASVGEILQYTLRIYNDENFSVDNVVVNDYLPLGIKYRFDTAKLENKSIRARVLKEGKHLHFDLATLAAKSMVEITFIAEIGAGIGAAQVLNKSWVNIAKRFKSNTASATTLITEELIRSKGIIIGQIYECANKSNKRAEGIAGVRLYMENGTYTMSDKNGKYHIEGVEVGTHVVQVDEAMLPSGYEMGQNRQNARHAGRNFSQFVNLGRGEMKRVDFCLKRLDTFKKETHGSKSTSKIAQNNHYTIPTSVPVMTKYNSSHLKAMKGKTEILWPPERFVPNKATVSIAVVHQKDEKAEIWLNDQKVSIKNYKRRVSESNHFSVIDIYKGVKLLTQTNTITVKILNIQKQIIKTLSRTLHVSNTAVKIEYLPKYSFAVADGKHSPVIAVKFVDGDGYPLRAGFTGTFSIEAPYASQVALDQIKKNPLGGATVQNRYTIHSAGIAYITLEPTTHSGTASLHFKIQDKDEVIHAWLQPEFREWVMVGFAEGTLGYNTLKSHQESYSTKEGMDKTITEGRVSFFAKGRIKGKWLLTMAYDSGKEKKDTSLFDEIDPNRYYTLYNDASVQNYEASSRKKLFLKIEKEHISALFGDFSTNMTHTQLSQYSRQMTGVKGEYQDEHIQALAFVSQTEQLFMKDEFPGDGTSGYYHLSSRPLIVNSESVTIEIRERYHNQNIIEKKTLQRLRDYEIDYDRGTLYFKEAIYRTDKDFNPQFIVVDYEIKGDDSKHYTYGGRAALRSFDGALEVGGSYIHEDTVKSKSELYGGDTTIKIGSNTVIKAEYAKTKITEDNNTSYGDAKLAEIVHLSNGLFVRAYYREQENSFGLGQISSSLGAVKKIGIDTIKRFENRLSIKASLYRDTDLKQKKDQDVFEFKTLIDNTLWSAYTGYRYADHIDTEAVHQILFGASYRFFDQKLKFSSTHDQSIGTNEDKLFPTKTIVGLDYALTSSINLFTNYEWAQGTQEYKSARVGMRYRPWSGMKFENARVSEQVNDATRVYNTLGMLQTYQFDENWSLNAGYESGELHDANLTGDNDPFAVYILGVNYQNELFSSMINGRYRNADKENKYNFTVGVYTQASDDIALALSAGFSKIYDNLNEKKDNNVRLSAVYRPDKINWIFLEKLDYIYARDSQDSSKKKTEKIINNLNFNYTPNPKIDIAFQHGLKYIKDAIEEYEHTGFTHLLGLDAHYDIGKKWEIGAQKSVLYVQSSDNFDYGFGLYTGYNIFDNMIMTAGYNWEGFDDKDFSLYTYRIEGPYLQFKMKLDQRNLKDVVKLLSW